MLDQAGDCPRIKCVSKRPMDQRPSSIDSIAASTRRWRGLGLAALYMGALAAVLALLLT